MPEDELAREFLQGRIDRRTLIQGLLAVGLSLTGATALAESLVASAEAAAAPLSVASEAPTVSKLSPSEGPLAGGHGGHGERQQALGRQVGALREGGGDHHEAQVCVRARRQVAQGLRHGRRAGEDARGHLEDALAAHEANWRDYFTRNGIDPMEIVYEDFVAGYETTVRAVLAFLGETLPSCFVLAPPSLRKQSDALSEEMLADYLRRRPYLPPAPAGTVWSREAGGLVRPDASQEDPPTPGVTSVSSGPSVARPSIRY